MGFDLEKVIIKLREKRPVFHSEADFKFALAWEIQTEYSKSRIRMEYPQMVSGKNFTMPTTNTDKSDDSLIYVDILVRYEGSSYPIELKYKKAELSIEYRGELYNLKKHEAKTDNVYIFVKDICRIESLGKALDNFEQGYTLWLTNDLSYLQEPTDADVGYANFSVHQGAIKTGTMNWNGPRDIPPLTLRNEYTINWKDYSNLGSNNGEFKYALLQVNT